mmetsp:Transcript_14897/g.14483  ORF Transcript_14897/g.14483 Transcript_14897/m.14483 type:complete len:109 (+) Transcript_14897:26-352(+)
MQFNRMIFVLMLSLMVYLHLTAKSSKSYSNLVDSTVDPDFLQEDVTLFIVPHSHTDPGWIFTMEEYYKREVHSILNNVLTQLKSNSKKTFVWAETCFLKMYYEKSTPT